MFLFLFLFTTWVLHSKDLSKVKSKKGKQNVIFCHNPHPNPMPISGSRFGGNMERTENENRVMLWCLISDHRASVAFLFAHRKLWGMQKQPTPQKKYSVMNALVRNTALHQSYTFIKDRVLWGTGPKPGEEQTIRWWPSIRFFNPKPETLLYSLRVSCTSVTMFWFC